MTIGNCIYFLLLNSTVILFEIDINFSCILFGWKWMVQLFQHFFGKKSYNLFLFSIWQAFMTTWIAACRNTVGPAKFLIPQRTFLVGPVTFAGPCKSFPITLENQGTVKATTDVSAYSSPEWFSIEDITGFILTGSGVFDGQGLSVWPYNDCKKNNLCQILPIVTIYFSFHSKLQVFLHSKLYDLCLTRS